MNKETTVVLDVGARYGMHPTWNDFKSPVKYIMFEPDTVEAIRLRQSLNKDVFEIFETALGKNEGEGTFYLLKHRGLSSFLKPDLKSECFRRLKPGQAQIQEEITLKISTIDAVMAERNIQVDFLKIDTEGTEHDVIEGASKQLSESVLGVRSSCNFQPCFIGQKLFSETHDFLLEKEFFLLNIDYRGYGYPRLGLFRKPEPIEAEDFRYGVLVAADAVWIRHMDWCAKHFSSDRDAHDFSILKLAVFCLLNNGPDVGIDILREHMISIGKQGMSALVKHSSIYNEVKFKIANFLGRWRTVPDEQWERVQLIFEQIYGEVLAGGSDFYPQIQFMQKHWEGAIA